MRILKRIGKGIVEMLDYLSIIVIIFMIYQSICLIHVVVLYILAEAGKDISLIGDLSIYLMYLLTFSIIYLIIRWYFKKRKNEDKSYS